MLFFVLCICDGYETSLLFVKISQNVCCMNIAWALFHLCSYVLWCWNGFHCAVCSSSLTAIRHINLMSSRYIKIVFGGILSMGEYLYVDWTMLEWVKWCMGIDILRSQLSLFLEGIPNFQTLSSPSKAWQVSCHFFVLFVILLFIMSSIILIDVDWLTHNKCVNLHCFDLLTSFWMTKSGHWTACLSVLLSAWYVQLL